MYLEIACDDNPASYYDFATWLITDIANFVAVDDNRDNNLEELWDKYFQSNDYGWYRDSFNDGVAPTVNYIINTYFSNLIISKQDSSLMITTDPNLTLYGTDITIDMLATVINFGTLTEPPYPYFDYVFEKYAENIGTLYSMWADGVYSE